MKTYLATFLLLTLTTSFNSVAVASICSNFYQTEVSHSSKSQIIQTPSGRKIHVQFDQSEGLKKGDEIIVAIHGLGKTYADMQPFVEASLAKKKSVFGIDLLGHGETRKLNPKLNARAEIPYQYNVEDVLYILQQLGLSYKLKIVGHSYGGGIALAVLERMEKENLTIPITEAVLLSPLVKNLDKYYSDALISGQFSQITGDMTNSTLNMMGVHPAWIKMYDSLVNHYLFAGNAFPQQLRDSFLRMNPYLDMWREWFSRGPNTFANISMGPAHVIANAEIKDVQKWQKNPMGLMELIMNNISTINGARDLNFLDFSRPLQLPKNIPYRLVMALNDSVVPNTINQEFAARMIRSGYNIHSQMLDGENHYYIYSESVKKQYNSLIQ